nr:hypothetical protein [Deltaproteobacteria bacterium]
MPDTTWEEPAQSIEDLPEPEPELLTVRGIVEWMDPCTRTIGVDGTTIDVSRQGGNSPMYSTYQIGDFVEVTYREYKAGNILNSIELIQERLE